MATPASTVLTTETAEQQGLSALAAAARRRRFLRALHDLGLDRICGPDWIGFTDGKFTFGDMSDRASDAFLRRLEDLAARGTGSGSPTQMRITHQVLDDMTGVIGPVAYATRVGPAHVRLPV